MWHYVWFYLDGEEILTIIYSNRDNRYKKTKTLIVFYIL